MSTKEEQRALTKADPFLETLQKAGEFVKSHQNAVAASVALLLLVGVGASVALNQADKKAEEASKLLAVAIKTYDKRPAAKADESAARADGFKSQDEWRAAVTDQMTAVQTQFPGSGAAHLSRLYLAGLAYEAGDAVKAEDHYRAFLAATKASDPAAQAAQLGLAAALEDQKKYDDALKVLNELAGKPLPVVKSDEVKVEGGNLAVKPEVKEKVDAPPLGADALMAMARIYETQGKTAEAKTAYERVKNEHPTGTQRFKADQRLTALAK